MHTLTCNCHIYIQLNTMAYNYIELRTTTVHTVTYNYTQLHTTT